MTRPALIVTTLLLTAVGIAYVQGGINKMSGTLSPKQLYDDLITSLQQVVTLKEIRCPEVMESSVRRNREDGGDFLCFQLISGKPDKYQRLQELQKALDRVLHREFSPKTGWRENYGYIGRSYRLVNHPGWYLLIDFGPRVLEQESYSRLGITLEGDVVSFSLGYDP